MINTCELNAYRKVVEETMPPEKSMAEVFRRLLSVLGEAGRAIDEKDAPRAHENLILGQEAMIYLSAALNREAGELPANLERLYAYINGLLVRANLDKDRLPLEEAMRLLQVLREGWEEAEAARKRF